MFAQRVVGGLAAGSLCGLMALGLILIYKTTCILNFGQGDTTMLARSKVSCFLRRRARGVYREAAGVLRGIPRPHRAKDVGG